MKRAEDASAAQVAERVMSALAQMSPPVPRPPAEPVQLDYDRRRPDEKGVAQ